MEFIYYLKRDGNEVRASAYHHGLYSTTRWTWPGEPNLFGLVLMVCAHLVLKHDEWMERPKLKIDLPKRRSTC